MDIKISPLKQVIKQGLMIILKYTGCLHLHLNVISRISTQQ